MKIRLAVLSASFVLLLMAVSVQAHHPFNAEYDSNKVITLSGTVTKVEWTNPHAHLVMDVRDEKGQTSKWDFELGGVNKLRSLGWKKDSLKMGDQVTVSAWQARNGSNHASANTITRADGTKLAGGSSFFEAPKAKAHTGN